MFNEERLREAEVWIASLAPREVMTMQGNLCKSVLTLIAEVRRLNEALEQMTDHAARTGGALQTAHRLFLEAAEAAEEYHAAWVDAGEYWKARVAELEAEVAAPYCSFCGGNHWGNEHR